MAIPTASRGFAAVAVAGLLVALGRPVAAFQQPNDAPPEVPAGAVQDNDAGAPVVPEGMNVLTRGPVHEAFAEPVVFDPKPGPMVPKAPPDPIEEVPPDQRPDGADVVWIPGYWAWDDSRNDFLWVSGLWRSAPPGRQWVPGYWCQVEDGYQWTPGAWMPLADQAPDGPSFAPAQYLPAPPPSLEAGPSGPPPGDDFTWAPGNWSWLDGRYAWRPGYWVPLRQDWVWTPAHYVWTPGGYLFVPGYWDRAVVRRGVLFAPVYFQQPLYNQPNFAYRPSIALLAGSLLSNLFVRPNYHQYYFGDYYAPNNFQSGIYPWFSFHQSRYGYDPIYSHYRALNIRRDPRWDDDLRRAYLYRRDHADARPPRTFVPQRGNAPNAGANIQNLVANISNATNGRDLVMARPIGQLAANDRLPIRFERVQPDHREQLQRQARELQQFRAQRLKQEAQSRPGAEGPTRPRSFELPRSPVVARAPRERAASVPPPIPALPRPDQALRPPGRGEEVRRRPEPHPDFRPPREVMRPRFGEPGPRGPGAAPGAPGSPLAPGQPGAAPPAPPNRGERREAPKREPRPERRPPSQATPPAPPPPIQGQPPGPREGQTKKEGPRRPR